MNVNVLIAFYSRYGNVKALAEAIAQGAQQVPGANVRLRRVPDLAPESVINGDDRWRAARDEMARLYPEPTNEDLEWCDALILGSPTRFGNPTAEIKLFIDKTGPLWMKGALVNKIASAFTSTSTLHGGNEATILTMLIPLMHHGMILAPPGYADPAMFEAGTPYGASSVSGGDSDQPPTEADLAAARFAGKRTAELALMLKRGKQEG